MKLKAIGFSTNSRGDLKGTVVAYSDGGEPLGVEHTGNYSRDASKHLMRKLGDAGVDLEVAQAQQMRLLARLRASTDEAMKEGPPQRERELPVLYTTGRQFREVVDDSWRLLVNANSSATGPRYLRLGDALVHLDPTAAPVRSHLLGVASLRLHLDRLGDYTFVDSNDQERPARPPRDVLESMIAAVPNTLPPLHGVVQAPFLAPFGEVVTVSGYHAPTGLYLALGTLTMPMLPERPGTQEIAQARRLILEEVLGDFPFTSAADRAHSVAAILTPFVRPLIQGPTPLFMIEAPVEGTGKGLLASVVSYIATGGPPAARTEGRDDDEWRKRITALLLGTPSIVLLDNLRRRLVSGALSSAITAQVWSDRLLGFSRDVSIPVRTTWLATANNPAYSGEMARRVVRSRLDAGVEHPWERAEFRHPDLLGWVQAERGRLVWAVLVLIRAWVTAGRPEGTEVMGSFEAWASTIGGILQVLGIPGLLTNRQEVYAQAQVEGEAWRTLLEVWWLTYAGQRIGVDQLMGLATDHKLLTDIRAGRSERGARTALGMELARLRDRVMGFYRIRSAGVSGDSGAALYRLEKLAEGREKVTEVTEAPISVSPEPTEPTEPFPIPVLEAHAAPPALDPWDEGWEPPQ